MSHIIVELGGATDQLRLVEWAVALGRRRKSRLTVLDVLPPDVDEPESQSSLAGLIERHEVIEATLTASGHEGLDIAVRDGDAIDELIRFGEEHAGDLLVVARRAAEGAARHDPIGHLLHHTTLPVVVLGDLAPIPPPDLPLTMIVGIDGSAANAAAAERIAELVEMFGATAVPVLCAEGAHGSAGADGPRRVAESLWPDQPLQITSGAPAESLTSFGLAAGAAVIAVGVSAQGLLHDHVGRQLGEHLIGRSDLPILIVPSGH